MYGNQQGLYYKSPYNTEKRDSASIVSLSQSYSRSECHLKILKNQDIVDEAELLEIMKFDE